MRDRSASCSEEWELTRPMMKAAVAAFYEWDAEKYDPEMLVAMMFFAMRDARNEGQSQRLVRPE